MVQMIVEGAGGRIQVESAPGAGTLFPHQPSVGSRVRHVGQAAPAVNREGGPAIPGPLRFRNPWNKTHFACPSHLT